MEAVTPARERQAEENWMRVLRALADPTRYRMVVELAAAEELSCGQIGEQFPLAQPTISHHIKILTDAGLLHVRRQGQHSFISLRREVLQQALAGVGRQLSMHSDQQA
jgi:ArsR family transcriptional regulator